MLYTVDQIRPMPGWSLCRMYPVSEKSKAGLHYGKDISKDKTTEGVCEVLAVTPACSDEGDKISVGYGVGDLLLFREFLRYANQVGRLVAEKDSQVFLLNNRDALCVLPRGSEITIGHYGEYQL